MRSLTALIALALAACAAETSSPAVADHFELVQGGAQQGVLGLPLDSLIRVRLIDDMGRPMPGIAVTWSVASGGGALPSVTQVTDASGDASAQWQLGYGPDPQQVRVSTPGAAPFTVTVEAPAAEFTRLAVGNSFACGLDADDLAWCWGSNFYHTLAQDSLDWSPTPLQVGDGSLHFIQLAAGDSHICGRTATGEVWCWGARFSGQLGDGGTGASSPVPTRPTGLPAIIAIDAQWDGTCGIATDASLWCWGMVGTEGPFVVPTVRFGGNRFRQIAMGDRFGCGILADSTIACFGSNLSGELGQGTAVGSSVTLDPIATPIKAVALDAGSDGACAITTARDLYCWGTMAGMPGHRFSDADRGMPSRSTQDSPALRISLGWTCGAIWRAPTSPRLLCPQGYTRDIEALPSIVEFDFGYATLCLRAAGGVTFCKNYSDAGDPLPFAYEGSAIPAP